MKLSDPWKTYQRRVHRFFALPRSEKGEKLSIGIDRFLRQEQRRKPVGSELNNLVEDFDGDEEMA